MYLCDNRVLIGGGLDAWSVDSLILARLSLLEGFEYATYNDVEDLKRVVKKINRKGKIRSLLGKPRRAVAAIMVEALQVRVQGPRLRASEESREGVRS